MVIPRRASRDAHSPHTPRRMAASAITDVFLEVFHEQPPASAWLRMCLNGYRPWEFALAEMTAAVAVH